jgi:hypothetical protein
MPGASRGYRLLVADWGGFCAFDPCPDRAADAVRLLVDGDEVLILACARHASWLRAYSDEDPDVQELDPPA